VKVDGSDPSHRLSKIVKTYREEGSEEGRNCPESNNDCLLFIVYSLHFLLSDGERGKQNVTLGHVCGSKKLPELGCHSREK